MAFGRNFIASIADEDVELTYSQDITLKLHLFFVDLFGHSFSPSISINWSSLYRVSPLDIGAFTEDFNLDEIWSAVFSLGGSNTPCPGGFSFSFFQKYWNLMQVEILALLQDFHKGELDLSRLNFALGLLPYL